LANLGERPYQHSMEMPGRLVYSVPADTADKLGERMPPWSAAWFLTE
jgi:hypothetical protein